MTSDPTALEALRRSGALAGVALDALPATSVIVFDHDLRFVLTAGEALRSHGYDPEKMRGRRLEEAVPERLAEVLAPHYRAALRGEDRTFLQEASRTERCFEVTVTPVRHEGEIVGGMVIARDITAQRAAERAREESERRYRDARRLAEAAGRAADAQFRAAFDRAPIGMALVAPDGAWLRVNPALCAILGYSHEALLEKRFQDLTHPDDLDADLELVRRVLDGRIPSYQMEKRYLHADGSVVWAQLSVSLVCDEEGRPLHFVSQVTDISDRKHLEAELRRLATHDDLTGLHNRRAFEREIERQLRRVKRYGEQCAVLLADLDDFKSVNDTLGHHAGDELLRHVAELLTRRLRESDVVARLGGDEFAVLLAHTDLAAAKALARALEGELAAHPLRVEGTEVVAHASIGAAALDADVAPEDALRHADRAMYAVKRARRLAGPERRERRSDAG
jgi:diguanylate cyclase (GGDEF)-like protein/PAS domain S-box-containing protein